MRGRPWTPEEDALVLRQIADGRRMVPMHTWPLIAGKLGRTCRAVRFRAVVLRKRLRSADEADLPASQRRTLRAMDGAHA